MRNHTMSYNFKSVLLALVSAILLWIAWPPHSLGWISLFAFVPLLQIQDYRRNKLIKPGVFRLLIYCSLLLWNIFTTWWVWNASPGGSIAAIVFNTLFMSVVWWTFDIVTRKTGNFLSYTFLISFWMAYELLHLNWDITWPWLVLGNVFANNTLLIQWYEFTGHLGGSVWVLLVNVLLFLCVKNFNDKPVLYKKITWAAFIIFVPVIISVLVLALQTPAGEGNKSVHALIIQPNLNPYTEKFSDTGEALSSVEQLERMLRMAEENITEQTEFVILPETALQGLLKESDLKHETLVRMVQDFVHKHPNTCVVTGVDSYDTYPTKETETARQYRSDGMYLDFFNAAYKIDTSEHIEIYHKSRLVPGVEKMPYPKIFGGLVKLLQLGAQTGGLGTQKEASVFTHHDIKVAPLICYESVFGGYVQHFIKKDANALIVVTNDGWWGNTDGYKQHLDYGRLRCIEFRKELLQCANTGLSAYINTNGDIVKQTNWWKQEVLEVDFTPNNIKTFYAEYGDYVGWLSTSISLSILIWFIARSLGFRNK
jgi:apolipoprotein N-acyltransferase